MELSVVNIKGQDTGRKIVLDDAVFGIEPKEHAVYLDVKQYLANQRQGTHKSKERSEISGSTRKLIRQKGGGGARRGDINSPVLVGGGRVFGPVPRSYSFKLNKKLKGLARRSALSARAAAGEILVVENFDFEAPKTKSFIEVTKALGVEGQKALFVAEEVSSNVALSARNIPTARVMNARQLNTYAVLNCKKLILTEASVAVINEQFKA